jgi:hypothetical protein
MAVLAALYAMASYVLFLATFVWAVGFVGNLPIFAKTIDSGAAAALPETLVVDLALLGLFAVPASSAGGPS